MAPRPWKPKRHRRRRRLPEPVVVLFTEPMLRVLDASAALMGLSRSGFVRSAVLIAIDRARDVQPDLPLVSKEEA